MQHWPWDIELDQETTVSLDIDGRPLLVERLDAKTLRYQVGEDSSQARLVGVAETADRLRFVPTLGPNPLLIFPQTPLLCPAGSTVRCVVRLPLHLRVGVGRASNIEKIDELAPTTFSRAVYGPVDSGVLCSSVYALNAPTIEGIERLDAERDAASVPLARPMRLDGNPVDEERRELIAYGYVRARNSTDEPLTISKIMVPADGISLYQQDGRVHTNEVSMRLTSAQVAELDFLKCPVAEAKALVDLEGKRTDAAPKTRHLFNYTYRSKTGLEYGF